MPTAAVRASTTQRARKNEVFDKMTTVRGLGGSGDNVNLLDAIAAAISAGEGGRQGLERISEKMQAIERTRHAKDMKRRK
jgi:hypothetical protein